MKKNKILEDQNVFNEKGNQLHEQIQTFDESASS